MNRFKVARTNEGLSQKEIAISLGVSVPTVSDWESGKKFPSGKNLVKLAQVLHTTTDFLLGCEELRTFFCEDGWYADQTQDYNKLTSDDMKRRFLAANGYDKDHASDAERLFPTQYSKKEPTPAPEDGPKLNKIQIAGRDGSFLERELTDEQLAALKLIVDQLPDADNL